MLVLFGLHGLCCKWQRLQREWQAIGRLLGEGKARGLAGGWQGLVRRSAKSRRWLTRAAVGSEGGESGKWAGEEKMGSKWSNSALEGNGWPGVQEGMGSKCRGAVECTGGEPKVAEQPQLQPSRWTLKQKASNVRC